MFWASIVDSKIIYPFKIDNDKINAENYSKFLEQYCFEWCRSQPRTFMLKIISMQDNVLFTFCKADYCPPCQERFKRYRINGILASPGINSKENVIHS